MSKAIESGMNSCMFTSGHRSCKFMPRMWRGWEMSGCGFYTGVMTRALTLEWDVLHDDEDQVQTTIKTWVSCERNHLMICLLAAPVFKPRDPHRQSARLEHHFTANKLSTQVTKFSILSTALPGEVAERLRQYIVPLSTDSSQDKSEEEILRCT